MAIISIDDSQFEKEVEQSDGAVLVKFWAEWCGPCRQIAPILEEIAQEKAGELKIVKVNIDDNPETPGKYGIRGIPTMLLFQNGKQIGTKVGAVSKSIITTWLDDTLNS